MSRVQSTTHSISSDDDPLTKLETSVRRRNKSALNAGFLLNNRGSADSDVELSVSSGVAYSDVSGGPTSSNSAMHGRHRKVDTLTVPPSQGQITSTGDLRSTEEDTSSTNRPHNDNKNKISNRKDGNDGLTPHSSGQKNEPYTTSSNKDVGAFDFDIEDDQEEDLWEMTSAPLGGGIPEGDAKEHTNSEHATGSESDIEDEPTNGSTVLSGKDESRRRRNISQRSQLEDDDSDEEYGGFAAIDAPGSGVPQIRHLSQADVDQYERKYHGDRKREHRYSHVTGQTVTTQKSAISDFFSSMSHIDLIHRNGLRAPPIVFDVISPGIDSDRGYFRVLLPQADAMQMESALVARKKSKKNKYRFSLDPNRMTKRNNPSYVGKLTGQGSKQNAFSKSLLTLANGQKLARIEISRVDSAEPQFDVRVEVLQEDLNLHEQGEEGRMISGFFKPRGSSLMLLRVGSTGRVVMEATNPYAVPNASLDDIPQNKRIFEFDYPLTIFITFAVLVACEGFATSS